MDSCSENENHQLKDVGFSLLNGDTNDNGTVTMAAHANHGNFQKTEIEIENEGAKPLIYRVNDNPPLHLTFIFAFQQFLVIITFPLLIMHLVAEVTCCQTDDSLKVLILSRNMFVAGISTLLMTTVGIMILQQVLLVMASPLNLTLITAGIVCMQSDQLLQLRVISDLMFVTALSTFLLATFGVRLPIFQGPSLSYIIPLLAMTTVKEWSCPATFKQFDPSTNQTTLMAYVDNATAIPARDLSDARISELSGSLMAVGAVHCFIGLTGLVGFLIRFIGPITIVPTMVMLGLNVYKMVVKFMEPHMGVGFIVIVCNLIFSLLLGKKQTPIPWWSKEKGFHIFWYPLHNVLSILISMVIGWVVSIILTETGALTDDTEDVGYLARSDSRNLIIEQSDWFLLPYAGHFRSLKVNPGVFVNFLLATLLSVLDSIGDYAAAARMARVRPPPQFAFNRGIAVEGLMSFFAGAMGSCSATVSYGISIGAMGITRVVSRRVFQALGLFFIICSVLGKIGAFFTTIPYPVLGGTTLITIGIFIGVVLSYLQTVDLTSTRNLAIVGISMLSSLVMPHWVSRNGESINTGSQSVDLIVQMLLSNCSFIAGVFACVMDNLVPGTMKERGIVEQMKDLDEADDSAESFVNNNNFYLDGPEVYRLSHIPMAIRRSRIARKLFPIFDYEDLSYEEEHVYL